MENIMNPNFDDDESLFYYLLNDHSNFFYLTNSIFTIWDVSTNNPSTSILFNSLYDTHPVKSVISNEEKANLIPFKYKDCKNKEKHSICPIFQEEFKDDDDIIQLPCEHAFFVEPILKWLSNEKAECPVCRYKFESVEISDSAPTTQTESIPTIVLFNSPTSPDFFNFASPPSNSNGIGIRQRIRPSVRTNTDNHNPIIIPRTINPTSTPTSTPINPDMIRRIRYLLQRPTISIRPRQQPNPRFQFRFR